MIVKLLPTQITDLWDSIRYGIIKAVDPIVDPTPDNIQDIYCQLMRQDIQCWCVFDEDKNIYGYITTSINIDIHTNFRCLVIYSLFLYRKVSSDEWESGINILKEYAIKNKCERVIAYTNNDDVVSIASKAGFQNYSYLVLDI